MAAAWLVEEIGKRTRSPPCGRGALTLSQFMIDEAHGRTPAAE
jgi:hypothetical protein